MRLQKPNSNRSAKRWRGRTSRQERCGAAVVETALLLPALVLLAFGSIELSNMVFIKQSLSIAAYEGARTVSKPGSTAQQADTRIREVLTSRNMTSYTVEYTTAAGVPVTINSSTPRGTQLTVSVRSNNGGAAFGPMRLFTGRTIRCQTTMVRQ